MLTQAICIHMCSPCVCVYRKKTDKQFKMSVHMLNTIKYSLAQERRLLNDMYSF